MLEYRNFLQYRSLFVWFQQNYFDGPTKLFSDLYPAKDPSAKSCIVLHDYTVTVLRNLHF